MIHMSRRMLSLGRSIIRDHVDYKIPSTFILITKTRPCNKQKMFGCKDDFFLQKILNICLSLLET